MKKIYIYTTKRLSRSMPKVVLDITAEINSYMLENFSVSLRPGDCMTFKKFHFELLLKRLPDDLRPILEKNAVLAK